MTHSCQYDVAVDPVSAMNRAQTARSAGATGRRAVIGLVLTAVLAFVVVGAAAFVVAHRIARADALAEGLRTAHGVGRAVFAPELPAVLAGDRSAFAALDSAVASRRQDGTLVRVKVWRQDGTVVWSDDHSLIGRSFPLSDKVAAVFDRNRDYADISSPSGADRTDERGQFGHLVEADIPVTISDGRAFALEMYFPDTGVRQAETELGDRLVPFALLALLVLALAQLPVSIWLVRRVITSQQERDRMLDTVLVSAERERRLLARHLHDGVVQELAGAAYLLDASRAAAPMPAQIRQAMGLVTQTLNRAVGDLREMLVELHPRDLTSDNVADLIATAAIRACPDQQVTVTAQIGRPMTLEVAAFLYRCARECATNVAKHAAANRVEITLTSSDTGVRLKVRDDGVGIPAAAIDRGDGHMGLALLRQAAADLGGSLRLRGNDSGTLVSIELPAQ
jgi:two-component system NarL family sensor kinase